MFYSRQLLARKAPLGQIWMAATMKGKINRKELVKLNIINICEEIMNPSVPMALRLSGILMGGVVIVYERKVKLLYDDVNRLVVELNKAWKVKVEPADPTVLPKAKSQAKYKKITLPENKEQDIPELEQSLRYTDEHTTMMSFPPNAFITMRLDHMDDPLLNQNPQENHHQADTADITMVDIPDITVDDASMFNRFERFDIEGDEPTNWNLTPEEDTAIPSTLKPSPPLPEKPHQDADEILENPPNDQADMVALMDVEAPNQLRQRVNRRRVRRPATFGLDDEQSIIPGHIYQSWLQDTSDITSRKRNRNKRTYDAMTRRKIANLMELPPTVLVEGWPEYGLPEVHFPSPLLEMWRESTKPLHDSQPGTNSTPQSQEPPLTAPSEVMQDQDQVPFAFEDFQTGAASFIPVEPIIEKQRANVQDNNLNSDILMEELRTNSRKIQTGLSEANLMNLNKNNPFGTPGNSGDEVRSIPSSGSGHGFLSHNSEGNSSRSNRKRTYSPVTGLEPVDEEHSWQHADPNLKLARLYENEIMLETGPTQTQKHPITSQTADPITNSIRMQLKAHFETPGTPKIESLNHLASGLDRKRAASLFYQTCVLATQQCISVQQKVPYGDIFISKGVKI